MKDIMKLTKMVEVIDATHRRTLKNVLTLDITFEPIPNNTVYRQYGRKYTEETLCYCCLCFDARARSLEK